MARLHNILRGKQNGTVLRGGGAVLWGFTVHQKTGKGLWHGIRGTGTRGFHFT